MLLDDGFSAPVEDTHLFDCEAIFEVILPESNRVFKSGNSGKINDFDSIRDGGQNVAFSRAWSTNFSTGDFGQIPEIPRYFCFPSFC